MSEWIDHAAEAMKIGEATFNYAETDENAGAVVNIVGALTHATLALVEQQRIANLIALANAHHASKSYDDFEVARHAAVYALIDYMWHGPDDVHPIVHPNISAALGIEAS